MSAQSLNLPVARKFRQSKCPPGEEQSRNLGTLQRVERTFLLTWPASPESRCHALTVRVTLCINAIALILLLMNGLQIFNAHPSLYWGHTCTGATPPTPAWAPFSN
jgi:hypothetical protein